MIFLKKYFISCISTACMLTKIYVKYCRGMVLRYRFSIAGTRVSGASVRLSNGLSVRSSMNQTETEWH